MDQDTHNELRAESVSEVSDELIGILRNTAFGTEGKLRYRQKEIDKGLGLLRDLEFIQVKKGNRILATTGVIKRSTRNLQTLYIRYLSAMNPFRSGNKKAPEKGNISRTGMLRKQIGQIFTGHFEAPFEARNEEACFYAYVESDNVYSHNMCRSFGFEPVRMIRTLLFSRFSPKKHTSVKEAVQEADTFRKSLHNYYSDHSFYFDEDLQDRGKLYGFYKDEALVAGIRCWPVRWEIVEIPGLTGFLMQRVLPYLPFTSRLFNPGDMHFLAFDSAWAQQGHEDKLPLLMEHLCAEYGIHMGMISGDTESRLIETLLAKGRLGLLNILNGSVTAEVMIRPVNMNEASRQSLISKPVYVSAVDMT